VPSLLRITAPIDFKAVRAARDGTDMGMEGEGRGGWGEAARKLVLGKACCPARAGGLGQGREGFKLVTGLIGGRKASRRDSEEVALQGCAAGARRTPKEQT
jgi:hypothetical protein